MNIETKTFRQIRNDEKDIQAIADNYKNKLLHDLWLADGLQKDAIQNCWDARIDKKHGKGWECNLSIINTGSKRFLCITDSGTHGLNGTRFSNEEELSTILLSNKRDEDLACFLNSNWSSKSSEEGGSRGRGKTIFLAASKDKKVFFDSMRLTNKTYVFGEIYLDSDKQVKFKLHYEEAGKKRFGEITNNKIQPLHQLGTRVLILNPDLSIEKAIESGEILSFISNSRWEIIKKCGAKIYVDVRGEVKQAITPSWYEDTLDNIPAKEFPTEVIKQGTDYRVKRLVLRYGADLNLPEYSKGIAIQRGGMTIQRLSASELVHEEGMNDIYGWVELDRKLEEDIKLRCEGPEHLDFSWNTNPAKYLKDYLRLRVREFAKELKLIESEIAKRNKIQKEAEENALKSLSPLFKKLGLFGKKTGKRTKKKFTRKDNEPLRLSIADIKFPRDSRRVNYDESIENTYVIPINEFDQSFLVLVRLFIVSNEGKMTMLEEKEFNLLPGSGPNIGPQQIKITRNFNKDGYSLRARMISLEDTNKTLSDGTKIEKGTILYDRINKKFFVDMDPPESGPFHFQPKDKDDKEYLLFWEEEEDEGYIIFYNTLHPRIKPLLLEGEKLSEYLTEQGALIAFQIKLEEELGEEDNENAEFGKLIKAKDVTQVIPTIMRKHSEFLWDYKKG